MKRIMIPVPKAFADLISSLCGDVLYTTLVYTLPPTQEGWVAE